LGSPIWNSTSAPFRWVDLALLAKTRCNQV
jgi:hypothetical protein